MSSENKSKDKVAEALTKDPKRALIEAGGIESLAASLIEMLMDFFKNLFGTATSYRSDPHAQQVMQDLIQGIDAKSKDQIENGNYTEGYLFARQKAYFEAIHETAMSSEVTTPEAATHVAAIIASDKIKELDKKDFAQIAKNDYGQMSESELGKIRHKVSSEVQQMYSEGFDKNAQQLFDDVMGEELNNLIETRSQKTLSPAEKQGMSPKNQALEKTPDNINIDREKSHDNEISSPSSGPGR